MRSHCKGNSCTTTLKKIKIAPNCCHTTNCSFKMRNARMRAITGSKVEIIDARLVPKRIMPIMKANAGNTVLNEANSANSKNVFQSLGGTILPIRVKGIKITP